MTSPGFIRKRGVQIFLRRVLTGKSETSNWLCTENEIGVAVNSLDEALAAIAKIRTRGHHKVVVKEAFGVAGSNALRLFEPKILPTQERWMENAFARKRELVVEPCWNGKWIFQCSWR